MSSRNAFQPRGGGLSVNLAVTAAVQTVTLPSSLTSIDGGMSARFVNSGTQDIFLRFDGVDPDTSTGMRMIPNSVEPFTIPNGSTIKVIAAATGSTLCITLGDGQ